MPEGKTLYVEFRDADTLRENGRNLFALLNAFSRASYQIQLSNGVMLLMTNAFGPNIDDFPPPARLALRLQNVTVVTSPPENAERCIYMFDRKDRRLAGMKWRKTIHVKFDLFSAYRFSKPMIMPYIVHPIHTMKDSSLRMPEFRSTARKLRVLFAGDTQGYKREWIHYPATKLSRVRILDAIKSAAPDDVVAIKSGAELETILGGAPQGKCVIATSALIDWTQWMPTIARADFLLCPPGIVMPMCHNIIEAMAVGTIPITNYAEWFSPKLKHLETCIVFDDERDLIEKLKLALEMEPRRLSALKENVIKYFDAHLDTAAFVRRCERRLDDRVTVLMYSEQNVVKHSSELGSRSILMRGEEAAGALAWATKCLPRFLR